MRDSLTGGALLARSWRAPRRPAPGRRCRRSVGLAAAHGDHVSSRIAAESRGQVSRASPPPFRGRPACPHPQPVVSPERGAISGRGGLGPHASHRDPRPTGEGGAGGIQTLSGGLNAEQHDLVRAPDVACIQFRRQPAAAHLSRRSGEMKQGNFSGVPIRPIHRVGFFSVGLIPLVGGGAWRSSLKIPRPPGGLVGPSIWQSRSPGKIAATR